jgi:hypothetical protein
MKRKFGQFVAAAVLGFLASSGVASATTVGMDTDPVGNRGDSTVRFAYWDTFVENQVDPPGGTTYTFDGVADGSSTLSGLSLSQNTPHALGFQGAGLLNGGDVYYSATLPQSWTLDATSAVDVAAMSFQIKTANVNTSVADQLFLPTLAGVGAGTFHSAQVQAEAIFGFDVYVIEYRWTGLNIPAGTPLDIQFAMAGGSSGNFTRKPVDLVSLDVTSVPEPGSVVLFGLGAIVVACGLRRRRATRSVR